MTVTVDVAIAVAVWVAGAVVVPSGGPEVVLPVAGLVVPSVGAVTVFVTVGEMVTDGESLGRKLHARNCSEVIGLIHYLSLRGWLRGTRSGTSFKTAAATAPAH